MELPLEPNDSRPWWREHAWPLACVLLAWGVYAGPLLSWSSNLYLTDTGVHDLPCRLYAARAIRSGEFPHWTPDLQCGVPLFAESQTGIAYPFFALYVLWPDPEMHDLFMALHYLLAGLFMYLFLVNVLASPIAGAVGGITFMAGTGLQSTHVVPGLLAAACWIPLALWLLRLYDANKRWAPWVCCLVNAVSLLAGHVYVALLAYSIQGCYLLAMCNRRTWRSKLVTILITLFLPVAVAGVQFVPLLGFVFASNRTSGVESSLTWEQFSIASVQPKFLLTFLNPSWFGDHRTFPYSPWEDYLVIFHGYAAILLLPIGCLLGRPRREVAFWLVLLVIALLLATGTPLLWLLYHVPVFNLFRGPLRYMLVFGFCVSILVGVGGAVLVRWFEGWRRHPQWARAGICLLPLFVLAGMHQTMGAFLGRPDFYEAGNPVIVSVAKHADDFRLLPEVQAIYNFYVASEEVLRENASFLPASYNLMYDVPVATLFDQGGTVTPSAVHQVMSIEHENYLRVCGVTHISGPASPDAIPRNREPGNPYAFELFLPPNEHVETIIDRPIYFGRYQDARPRAWMVYQAEFIPQAEARLERIGSDAFDPALTAIVEKPITLGEQPSTPGGVRWVETNLNSLAIEVETKTVGLLVVADAYSPEFQATLDGQPVELLRCNHAFRGVRVPAGRHRIRMQFRPFAFQIGCVISGISLAVVGIGLVRAVRTTR